ncbi:MAG: prephenate dehydrogenase/arogenate dehydrogenase family protein, partial [Acidimicrobiia bacterium]|nr:prephenate dehydrogenase/arogenate dehydrogenase family protein [Acidimicrobiia bacterium]
LAMALRRLGWTVSGFDHDPDCGARALELGAIDGVGFDERADLTFVATPVRAIAPAVLEALSRTSGVVSDVGSVKWPVVQAVDSARFVGGHPMAGSERTGVDGADPDLFRNAVWVLTPTETTDPETFTTVRSVVASLGAESVSMPAEEHDRMVAVVSHVPHLTAATLMTLADRRSSDHRALLRLAAGGFRDMTRIASGHPGIWPDICSENRTAILDALDGLLESLSAVREIVADERRDDLVALLGRAREARTNLPARYGRPAQLVEVLVPVHDRPGALADVTNIASKLDVNILDLEIRHSAEGPQGVMHLVVEQQRAADYRAALAESGFATSQQTLV